MRAGEVESDTCEHRNATWPSPCGKPAKATVVRTGKRVCGIHANSWVAQGWKVRDDR